MDAADEKVRSALERFQTLARDCGGHKAGILYWDVDRNLDERKYVHLVQLGLFHGDDAFHAFLDHATHKQLKEDFREIADWQAGDLHGKTLPNVPLITLRPLLRALHSVL